MPKNFDLTAEILSAVIGIVSERGAGIAGERLGKALLIRKIKKREAYLRKKYENKWGLLNNPDKDSFYEWLKEKRTIDRILSFSNADDIGNISPEQMRHSKEFFFKEAFEMAHLNGLQEKEELRKVLNDLFQYVDELFWKALDGREAFLYKKYVLEVRRSIRELEENITREIQYHESFAEYIDNRKVLQKVPYKLDYRSEEIPFFGRSGELKELDAFCDSEGQISWWAVIGRGGSGKSRLAYQYIKNNVDSKDWKMLFLHDEFFSQANGGGKYKNWTVWTYDRNLLVVIDYVQKYAKEVVQWIEALAASRSVTRKIRILLLERTDGEKALWLKEGFEKPLLASLKYAEDFLKLQSMDNDLVPFAMRYAGEKGRRITEKDAADAREKLQSIDADTRILYFIMILEAVFHHEPWRKWDRVEIADYIVRRERENIAVRFQNDAGMIRSYHILQAFCTATGELPFFELPQGLPDLIIQEIGNICCSGRDRKELCAVMQLEEGILQPFTPDIIGEYMVLSVLRDYFYDSQARKAFIGDLWSFAPENFLFFVYRLFEDHMDGGAFGGIMKEMLVDAVPYDDITVREANSNLLWGLTAIGDLNECLSYVEMLRKLYRDYSADQTLAVSYAKGLFNLSCEQELPEITETIERLEKLATEHAENAEIWIRYANGLVNLSYERELPEITETIERLRKLSVEHAENAEIQTGYAEGLFNLSCVQGLPERIETIGRLGKLAAKHAGNGEIQTEYAKGLVNLSNKQELPEITETIERLEELAAEHAGNGEIQTEYAKGLVNLSSIQELPERIETIGRLGDLAAEHAGNGEIQTEYAKGLVNLSSIQELPEITETIGRLRKLSVEHAENAEIQTEYANGLFNLSCEQELPERIETIERLGKLASEHAGNGEIQTAYAKGLVNLSNKQELPERIETIGRLEKLATEHAENEEIWIRYAKGLFNLSNKQEPSEKTETLEKLKQLAAEHAENEKIQKIYAKCCELANGESGT